eukprot:1181170-Prorocentrum_minimum.AAC.1
MPLVFFTFSRVLRRAWRLDSTDKSSLDPPCMTTHDALTRYSHDNTCDHAGRPFVADRPFD